MENKNSNQKPTNNKPPVQAKQPMSPGKILMIVAALALLGFMIWGLFFQSADYSIGKQEMLDKLVTGGEWDHWGEGNTYVQMVLQNNGFVRIVFTPEGWNAPTYSVFFDNIDSAHAWWTLVETTSAGVWPATLASIPEAGPHWFWQLLMSWGPMILLITLMFVMQKKAMDKQMGAGNPKKAIVPQISDVKFDKIAGYEEVKQEMVEVVDFLQYPAKYAEQGVRTPKGVLLTGLPGTGKTMFAKAVAGEAGVPFYSISGSDFVEMFVGVGASRVRKLFEVAKASAPSIIFIDEIDAVGRQRGAGIGGGNDEREQTLNQLLVEMDGFEAHTGVVVMAATNRSDILDAALKRPGRFDRDIEIRLPDVIEREVILKKHAEGKKIAPEVNWFNIANRTPGFSGAELANIINEAAILAIRWGLKEGITIETLDEATDRVMGGPSKPNNAMGQDEKKLVAIHEAGHAIIGLAVEKADEVQKISIVPRGQAAGYVLMTPKKEKVVQTKSELLAKIQSYMGGRAAEEIFYGIEEITSGASADIETATQIAKKMVLELGMSSLGLVQYDKTSSNPFMGAQQQTTIRHSEETFTQIDNEIRSIIEGEYKKAKAVVKEHKAIVEKLSESLMIKETLTIEEAKDIFKTGEVPQSVIDFKEFKEAHAKEQAEKKAADEKAAKEAEEKKVAEELATKQEQEALAIEAKVSHETEENKEA